MPNTSRTFHLKHLTVNKNRRNQLLKKGFTLVELLVVIAIIGVLASFIVASFTTAQRKARDARRKADLNAMKKALVVYKGDTTTDTYSLATSPPNPWAAYFSDGTYGANATCAVSLISLKCVLTTRYIKVIPQDPTRAGSATLDYYLNVPTAVSNTFILSADIENNLDPQRSLDCNPAVAAGLHDYCVTQD